MAHGVSTPVAAAVGRDLGWLVDRWAALAPERQFLTWAPFDGPVRRWTRAGFAADVARLATGLHRRGVRRGDRVVLVLANGPDCLLGWTALTSMGAVAVCLNPRSSRDELAYVARHCGPVGAFVDADRADDVSGAMTELAWIAVSHPTPSTDADSVSALLATEPEELSRPGSHLDPATIQYTSGTTARPKAVLWTQANCLWAGRVGALHQGLGPCDVNLLHLPLFHTNGLSYSFLSSLWSGGEVVLQPKFSASRFWDVSVRHRVTWTSVVSFCVRALADRDVPESHSYRGWGSSACLDAGPMSGGAPVIGWFGMTETVSHPVVGDLVYPDAPGTMGRPAPEYDVAVVDEDGTDVGPGGSGQLLVRGVRGVSMFSEYLYDEPATAAAFTGDGWFRTGDRVRRDGGGTLSFVERDTDVLKVGGENIGAPEIERVVLGAAGVREAAVVGRPDPMLGEVPVAFVTAHLGAHVSVAVLEARCAELLADHKRPRELRVVDELPRSTLDKVAKSQLRRMLEQEAGRA